MKIMVFGRPGSGKSTFSNNLSHALSIPAYHLDKDFFVENWNKRDSVEFLARQQNFVNKPAWIIDGNALQSLEMRYARADIAIYFNFPLWLCLWRIIKRIFSKDRSIDDRARGCREQVSWELICYTWAFESRKNYRFIKLLDSLKKQYPHVQLYTVCSDADVVKLQKRLES